MPTELPTRSCRYCKAKFKPIRQDQRFCKPAHRKSFWKYGGLPFDKMKEQIMKDIRKVMRAEIETMVTQEFKTIREDVRRLMEGQYTSYPVPHDSIPRGAC
jgi:hypothetical protein